MLHIFAPLKTSSTNPSRKNKNIKGIMWKQLITNHTGICCLVATSSDGSNYQEGKGDSQEEVRVDRSGPSSRRPLNASSVKPNVNDTASHVHTCTRTKPKSQVIYLFSLGGMRMCFQTLPDIPAHLSRTSLLQFGLITLITIRFGNVLWDDFNTRGMKAI